MFEIYIGLKVYMLIARLVEVGCNSRHAVPPRTTRTNGDHGAVGGAGRGGPEAAGSAGPGCGTMGA
jgi:hypothetical protein